MQLEMRAINILRIQNQGLNPQYLNILVESIIFELERENISVDYIKEKCESLINFVDKIRPNNISAGAVRALIADEEGN